jgi:hypothetical protein
VEAPAFAAGKTSQLLGHLEAEDSASQPAFATATLLNGMRSAACRKRRKKQGLGAA